MIDIHADKTFRVLNYIIDASDWIDKEILVSEVEYSCRVTELSVKDIKKINWVEDSVNNVYKLYTNETLSLITWDRIRFDWFEHKVLRPYKPTDLSGVVAYTKLYIVRLDE